MSSEPIFDRPWLLLCEGLSDKQFFHQLIRFHNICVGQFNIYFPGSGGKEKLARWVSTTRSTRPEFRENVEAVLIVADSDDDADVSFRGIQDGLRDASFPIPDDERTVARKPDYPAVVVLMLPLGEPGNLETLCVRAAYSKWGIRPALEKYVDATPASNWSLGKQSKMRLHAMLAATCASKPETSFAHLWQEQEEFHLPLGDPCFTDLVEFLKNFGSLLDAAPPAQARGRKK